MIEIGGIGFVNKNHLAELNESTFSPYYNARLNDVEKRLTYP